MPTWPSPSKKTRSPGSSWSRETGTPAPYCAAALCGREARPSCRCGRQGPRPIHRLQVDDLAADRAEEPVLPCELPLHGRLLRRASLHLSRLSGAGGLEDTFVPRDGALEDLDLGDHL